MPETSSTISLTGQNHLHQLLMWFCPVNEMLELISGMPAPKFGEEFIFFPFNFTYP
jgi:hypothetical protein